MFAFWLGSNPPPFAGLVLSDPPDSTSQMTFADIGIASLFRWIAAASRPARRRQAGGRRR
jgi:hypothetical protein